MKNAAPNSYFQSWIAWSDKLKHVALRCVYVAVLLITFGCSQSCLAQQSTAATSHDETQRRAAVGIDALQHWYDAQTGLYQTTGWWNSANAVTTLVDFIRESHSAQYIPVIANTFARAQASTFPGFLNNYYDDEGWWGLAWIASYDLTNDSRYLSMAQSIFADMTRGWDSTCGGGIWWSKDRQYKNAIANELFFSVAAHLASRAPAPPNSPSYRLWADREWQWFQGSGMINARHLINDGLAIDPATSTCRNNGNTVWTYNQGVILGALDEWSVTVNDPSLVTAAQQIADAALIHLTDGYGILHESCEPKCGNDGVQFKGVFMRNLGVLNAAVHKPFYSTSIQINANSIWSADQAPGNQFGVVWSGPPSSLGAGTQSSALDTLVAATSD